MFTTKLEARKTSFERWKAFERAGAHGKTILAAFENKIRGCNHESFIGIGIRSIAHLTGLLRHQGRSALVHRVSACPTEKHQSEGNWARTADGTNRTLA